MIANISNGEKTASIHLPYSSIQLAGVLSYLGDEHIKGCDLLCNGEMKNNIFVSLEPTGIAERNIVEITRMQDISLAMLNSEIRLLESMPYEHKLGVMDKIASERPKSIYNVRQLINSYNEPSVTTKFYCPLAVILYERNGCGDLNEDGYTGDGCLAAQYADKIRQSMRDFNAEEENIMEEYFNGDNSLRMKLLSVVWDFCERNNELFGCITVETAGTLTLEQELDIKEWIRDQNSDGLGESFEQLTIRLGDDYRSGEIYVSLWNSGDDYFIDNETEFEERLKQRLTMGGM